VATKFVFKSCNSIRDMEATLKGLEQVDMLRKMMKDPVNNDKLPKEAREAAKLRYEALATQFETQIYDCFSKGVRRRCAPVVTSSFFPKKRRKKSGLPKR
jgi:hypothetical protein